MPLSRNPRMDRRRRAIRENLSLVGESSDDGRVSPSRAARNAELPELSKRQRGVAYSHSVRRACQQRLVQFIPVRKLSLTGAVALSTLIPLTLIALHYLVFVSGQLDWSGHPMSALLNASSPRSLAAWMSSHLWLLCLGSTVLTFQLRRHKLDDYEGEYRLWFWLVFTCVIGSIDSTTRITELFGAALDRWSQLNVGWSGGAIVQATIATLVGMLGLRLCSELKAVPMSLLLWLSALVMWACSAALSQSLFQIDLSAPARSWLRASLWLSGLTAIWLSSLLYLRATFMAAQKRFLSRALCTSHAVPWQERLRQSMPSMPGIPQFAWRRRHAEQLEEADAQLAMRRKKPRRATGQAESPASQATSSAAQQTQTTARPTKRGWGLGLGKLSLRPPVLTSANPTSSNSSSTHPNVAADAELPHTRNSDRSFGPAETTAGRSPEADAVEVDQEYGKKSGWFSRRHTMQSKTSEPTDRQSSGSGQESSATKRSLGERLRWKRKSHQEQVDAQAEKAARQEAKRRTRNTAGSDPVGSNAEQTSEGSRRSWLKLGRRKLPKVSLPKPKLPKVGLPKLKLPSFRLPTPNEQADATDTRGPELRTGVPAINSARPLPSTSNPSSNSANARPAAHDEEDDSNGSRPLSKSERKRLKRIQREDDSQRRAA